MLRLESGDNRAMRIRLRNTAISRISDSLLGRYCFPARLYKTHPPAYRVHRVVDVSDVSSGSCDFTLLNGQTRNPVGSAGEEFSSVSRDLL